MSEELGDLLWYIANVASKFDLSLSDIAAAILAKVRERWASKRSQPLIFDAEHPEGERLPRRFEVELIDLEGEESQHVQILIDGQPFGSQLTDNAYDPGRLSLSRRIPLCLRRRTRLVADYSGVAPSQAQEPTTGRRSRRRRPGGRHRRGGGRTSVRLCPSPSFSRRRGLLSIFSYCAPSRT